MNHEIEEILQKNIQEFTKRQDKFIMDLLEKQEGFESLEKSKRLIEVKQMIHNEILVGTDYLFNGKRFLTIYPTEYKEENGKFSFLFNYREY